MYILVTGDRNWVDYPRILSVLSTLPVTTIVIHGDADGADRLAHQAALQLGMESLPNPAHWRHNFDRWVNVYGSCDNGCEELVGRPAGTIRNGAMLKRYPTIQLVLAFHNDLGNSSGTKDMVKRAVNKGIPVALFTATEQVMYEG